MGTQTSYDLEADERAAADEPRRREPVRVFAGVLKAAVPFPVEIGLGRVRHPHRSAVGSGWAMLLGVRVGWIP